MRGEGEGGGYVHVVGHLLIRDASGVFGLNLLLEIVRHPHRKLFQLLQALSEAQRRLVSVPVVIHPGSLQASSKILNALQSRLALDHLKRDKVKKKIVFAMHHRGHPSSANLLVLLLCGLKLGFQRARSLNKSCTCFHKPFLKCVGSLGKHLMETRVDGEWKAKPSVSSLLYRFPTLRRFSFSSWRCSSSSRSSERSLITSARFCQLRMHHTKMLSFVLFHIPSFTKTSCLTNLSSRLSTENHV